MSLTAGSCEVAVSRLQSYEASTGEPGVLKVDLPPWYNLISVQNVVLSQPTILFSRAQFQVIKTRYKAKSGSVVPHSWLMWGTRRHLQSKGLVLVNCDIP